MAEKKSQGGHSYAGRIKNTGTQKVEALFGTEGRAKSSVIKGSDLRSGKGK